MSLVINTNVAALNAYNNLNANQTNLQSAFAQLSSGLRINKAADDASGLAISQGLTSQINGLTQANSNVQDGINVAQIADGALGTVQNILQRMRTLVVQAANTGTQDPTSGDPGTTTSSMGSGSTSTTQGVASLSSASLPERTAIPTAQIPAAWTNLYGNFGVPANYSNHFTAAGGR